MDEMSDPSASWLNLVQKLSLCGRTLRRALHDLAMPRGLTDTDVLVMWACQQAGTAGQPQNDLAALVGVSPAQLSGLLEALGERGWLVGRRPSTDRRRQYWRTTPLGSELLALLLCDLTEWSHTSGSLLPLAQRQQLAEQLHALANAVSARVPVSRKEAA